MSKVGRGLWLMGVYAFPGCATAVLDLAWALLPRSVAIGFRHPRGGGENMKKRLILHLLLVICFVFGVLMTANAQGSKSKQMQKTPVTEPAEPPLPHGKNIKDAASQAAKSAKVFDEIMATPDKGIPTDLLNKAECVAGVPSVIKAGFIVGAKAGRGVASCRTRP